MEDLMGLEKISSQEECMRVISCTMNNNPQDKIYLLIHNIDGPMLRSPNAQDVLSRLASIPNIHLLSSIDHINAPLRE